MNACPVHDAAAVDAFGVVSCPVCTGFRNRLSKCRRENVRAGRHPRETLRRVSNERLREVFLNLAAEERIVPTRVAELAGLITRYGDRRTGDIERLRKRLGLKASSGRPDPVTGVRPQYFQDQVDYDTAVRICRAMGVDPVDVGI